MVETRRRRYQSPPRIIREKKKPPETGEINTTVTTQGKDKLNDKLTKLYEDIKSAPSYSAKINDFLRYHDVHSKHRRIVKRIFPRRRIIARCPFEILQMDLIVYNQDDIVHANGNYSYILVMIDVFTKFVWVREMKFKDAKWSSESIQSILDDLPEQPVHIISDHGLGESINPGLHYRFLRILEQRS